MAMIALLAFILFPTHALAMSEAEEAIMLNEEMAQLMKSSTKVKIWAAPGSSARSQLDGPRNGLAPSQMKGVDDIEDRYFKDEVSFQAAASDRINEDLYEDSSLNEEEPTSDYRMDGTVPKKRR